MSQIGKWAAAFSSGTFLSRISGMLRDMMFAMVFGTSASIAAFFVAFRFAMLLRRLLGESPLSSSFIPHFETHRTMGSKQAAQFFRDFYLSLALFLLLVIVVLELSLMGAHSQILIWTRVMLPGLFFICLSGLNTAYLQCNKHFFASGIAPLFFNVTLMAALFIFRGQITYLAWSVVVAYAVQFLITLPKGLFFLIKELSLKECLALRPFPASVRRLFVPFGMGILGIGAAQINSGLDMIFARLSDPSGPAFLAYAIRIYQLPLALFGIAFATALLPSLSRAEESAKKGLCEKTLEKSFFILFPAMCALGVLGFSGVNLLYGRGHFTGASSFYTTQCLWAYGVGLVPAAFTLIFAQGFYAVKDFKTPMIGAVIAVGVNIALNAVMVFLFQWQAISVALATSLSSGVNCLYLYKKMPFRVSFQAMKVVLGSLFATGVTFLVSHVIGVDLNERRFLSQLGQFLVPAVCFGGVYLGIMVKTARAVLTR